MATTAAGPTGSHDNDWTSAETAAGRNVGRSLWRGCSRKVPALRARSPVLCVSQSRRPLLCLPPRFHRTPADDLPAYLVIVIVGHVLVPAILWIEVDYAPSLAVQLGGRWPR